MLKIINKKIKKYLIIIILSIIIFIPNINKTKAIGVSFGGEIRATADCSGPAGCIPDSPDFALCVIPHCILGQNFIIQFFDNYAQQEKDGFDVMLDTVLEPQEKANCYPQLCLQIGIPYPTYPIDVCAIFCAANTAAQSQNKSYVGLKTEMIKKTIQLSTPGIAWINQPTTLMPPCNATNPIPLKKYILGSCIGQGFFTCNPGDELGDNCAGRYYPMMAINYPSINYYDYYNLINNHQKMSIAMMQ